MVHDFRQIEYDENGVLKVPEQLQKYSKYSVTELTNETGKVLSQQNEQGNITAIGGVCKAKDFQQNFASTVSNARDLTLGISN